MRPQSGSTRASAVAFDLDSTGPSTPHQYQPKRSPSGSPRTPLESIDEGRHEDSPSHMQDQVVVRLNLHYACCTQAGMNAGFAKDNQDSWVAKEHIGGAQQVLFGVFDGHGVEGKAVSSIVAQAMPKLVAATLPTMMEHGAYEELMVASFQECNRLLSRIDNLDCSMSGSTGVVAVLAASRLIVANLGDSRCILGRLDATHSKASAYEMSNDHTPELLAESTRVLAAGGRVASYACGNQPVGPLRVWLPDKDVPGLSMTRSFGDTIAAMVGVIDVPEVLVYDIQQDDRYMVLMSDGISQHMASYEIVDLVHRCAVQGRRPSKAAKRLVKEARRRWKAHDGSSADDCTAIVVYLEPVLGLSNQGPAASFGRRTWFK